MDFVFSILNIGACSQIKNCFWAWHSKPLVAGVWERRDEAGSGHAAGWAPACQLAGQLAGVHAGASLQTGLGPASRLAAGSAGGTADHGVTASPKKSFWVTASHKDLIPVRLNLNSRLKRRNLLRNSESFGNYRKFSTC